MRVTTKAIAVAVLFLAVLGAAAGHAGPPRIVDLGGSPGYLTTARGINGAGEIVGETYRTIDPDTETRESFGWIWRKDGLGGHAPMELGKLDAFPNSYPRGINDSSRVGRKGR